MKFLGIKKKYFNLITVVIFHKKEVENLRNFAADTNVTSKLSAHKNFISVLN